jgi:hypothetical protein
MDKISKSLPSSFTSTVGELTIEQKCETISWSIGLKYMCSNIENELGIYGGP